MSNIELARFLCCVMFDLAQMLVWYQRGNTERAKRCEANFRKRVAILDEMGTDGDGND